MSSFSLQNSQIRGALEAAGIPAAQAATIANILGNAAQAMRHSGVIEHDRTPQALRIVGPDARRHVFTELDFPQQDPDHRKPKTPPSERPVAPQPEPTVLVSLAPQQAPDAFRVAGGAYTSANGIGEATKVDLNVRFDGPCLFAEPATNTLHGKGLRAEAGGRDDGRVRFWIEERDAEAVWRLQMINVRRQDVVTGVEHQPGRGLVVTYQTIDAWSIGEPWRKLLPLPQGDINLTSPIVIGKRDDGLEWQKDETAAFRPYEIILPPVAPGDPPLVPSWQEYGVAVSGDPIEGVQNPFRYIAAGQFIAIAQASDGTWQVVEVEVGCPETGDHKATELSQTADDTSTDSQVVSGTGMQVMCNVDGCVKWIPLTQINYVTGVTLGPGGLYFDTANAWVFPSVNAGDPITIDTTECPPPASP